MTAEQTEDLKTVFESLLMELTLEEQRELLDAWEKRNQ